MGTPLTGNEIKDTYGSLAQTGNAGAGFTSALIQICDGLGTSSAFWVSTQGVAAGVPAALTGDITLYNASNPNTIRLRSSVATSNYVFTLPTTAGMAGQVLTTDGAGNLYWSTGSPPSTPTGLEAFGGVGGAYIQWDASAGATSYDLQSSANNASWSTISAGQVPLFFADVTGNIWYRVRAITAGGTSDYTAGVQASAPLGNVLAWLRSVNGFTAAVWTDQSGNSNSATQGTVGNQLSLVSGVLGGQPVVRSPDTARFMSFPNILPVNASFTVGVLFKLSDQSDLNVIMSGDSHTANSFFINCDVIGPAGQPLSLLWNGVGGFTGILLSNIGVGNPQTSWAFALMTMIKNPSPNSGGPVYNAAWYINGQCGGISPTFDGIHPGSATLNIGGPSPAGAGHGGVADYAEVFVTSGVPTASDVNDSYLMINATYGLALPVFAKQVLYVGDSITAGGKATASGGSWASLIAANNIARYYVNNGEPTATTGDMIAAATTRYYPYTSCGVPTSCTVMGGTNDLLFGVPAATVYANIVSLCNGLKAHSSGPIVVVGVLPSNGTNVARATLNGLLRNNWPSFADGFADVNTIPMGADGANTNLTYYNADQIHPNDTGHADLYALIIPILSSLW